MFNFNFRKVPSLEKPSPQMKLFHFKFMGNSRCSFGNHCNAEGCYALFKDNFELGYFNSHNFAI